MYKVGMQELRKRFSELVHRAGRGEMIGITKSGKFVAILRPPSQDEEHMGVAPAPATIIRKGSKKGRR
jgi:prevent-host-death family protein